MSVAKVIETSVEATSGKKRMGYKDKEQDSARSL